MKVNIGTKVSTANIAFSTSKNAALIEREVLQYTKLSVKLHSCTLSELITQIFTLSDVIVCLSKPCVDQKQHSNPVFSTKSVNITLETCVDIANEYLHADNIDAGVKNHLFCRLNQCKCAGCTMFLFAIVLSN